MIIQIFTIFDIKTGAYLTPIYQPTLTAATRLFINTCTDTTHPFNQNPEDFTLFYIGEYDDQTAKIEPMIPQSIMTAQEAIATKGNDNVQ